MNVTFTPKEQQAVVDENIVVDGEVVGYMKPYYSEHGADRFHTGIMVPDGRGSVLIQGFGVTREDAIRDALESGRTEYEAFLVNLADLAGKINA